MELEELRQKLLSFLKQNFLFVILCLAGFIFLSYGLMSFFGSSTASDQVEINMQVDSKDEAEISVDVEGAVFKPGVYQISSSGRIKDGLIAAGGLNELADREWVAKNLNLAAKLTDGAKIYIPKEGEQVSNQNTSTVSSVDGLININIADSTSLDTLPGVGKVTAEKIINGRPYALTTDLVAKKILGAAAFEKIKDKISAY
ncbi:helix-hairpin-helix domain-containing protein [Patescibacteria group bacterium]|nr:helix-hairpin-helix domain-containing protein [Patescibacteria group bacterium]